MQRCAAYRSARKLYRVKYGGRRQRTCAPYVYFNAFKHRFLFLGRVFKRHSPFRVFCSAAQLFAVLKAIHLYNRAVNIIGQAAARVAYALNFRNDVLYIIATLICR